MKSTFSSQQPDKQIRRGWPRRVRVWLGTLGLGGGAAAADLTAPLTLSSAVPRYEPHVFSQEEGNLDTVWLTYWGERKDG